MNRTLVLAALLALSACCESTAAAPVVIGAGSQVFGDGTRTLPGHA